ncbi:ABC transporter permease subunit [Saccharothrix sp. AJ9571]|nr:ABC transporter permease subunit [Saccharothrix sp. AJ9571]
MLDYLDNVAAALLDTLALTAVAFSGAAVLGVMLAGCRISPVPALRHGAAALIGLARGVPLLCWLMAITFGLPALGLTLPLWHGAVLVLAGYTAAYYAGALHSGVLAVSGGEAEAARALGLTTRQVLACLIVPQALRLTLPVLGNITVGLLLNTALAGAVGVTELTTVAEAAAFETADPVSAFCTVGAVYAALAATITWLTRRAHKRFAFDPGPATRGALFDAPGRDARRRHRFVTAAVLSGTVALGAHAMVGMHASGELDPAAWAPFTYWPVWRFLLEGVTGTAVAAVLALALSLPLGLLLALVLARDTRPARWARWPARAYVEIVPLVPSLLWLYAAMLILPAFEVRFSPLGQLLVALTLPGTAAVALILLDALNALPRGQAEAAASLGLRTHTVIRSVLLPQAVTVAVPSLIGQATRTVKDTALGVLVGFAELLGHAQVISGTALIVLQPYLVAGALYLVLTLALGALTHARRTRRRSRATPPSRDALVPVT